MNEETRRIIQAALLERRRRPHEERWQDMIDRGVIDAKGNVLLPAIASTDCTLPTDPETEAAEDPSREPAITPVNSTP